MKTISVKDLEKKIKEDPKVIVVDVRTPAEFRGVHFDGAINIPVEKIMSEIEQLKIEDPVYISCNSGNRSYIVCEDLALHGLTNLVNVDGGIQSWIKAGLPVIRSKKWTMPIMQQVMVIAGSLVLTGVIASQQVNPGFVWLSGAVGAGLLYAGLSGNCYMTKVLAMMPWNK